ncbi:MAG TPA: RHS repeat-associated core domain-containing protein [Anaerolineaceae bacterium]|jgi:RHS repeat-associated protein|nr:RHS repeat-associated core domain-containing protein [Anaerolineaceae bacterium]
MYFRTRNDCLSTRFVYDGADVVMELSANNEVIWAWVNAPGLDQPVERIAFINGTPRQRQVFHADGLGSIAALTDGSGATVQTYTYAAFGSIRTRTCTDLNRVTFTAREALGDSLELYYYRNRVLDPTTGRFTSEDPLGFVDGPNRYVYCANSPVNNCDPDGSFVITGALLIQTGLSAVAGIAEGYIISKISGEDYTLKNAVSDAAFGAAGGAVGAIVKAYKAVILAKVARTATRVTGKALDLAQASSQLDNVSRSAILVSDAHRLKYAADLQRADALVGVGAGIISEGAARGGGFMYDELAGDDDPNAFSSCVNKP